MKARPLLASILSLGLVAAPVGVLAQDRATQPAATESELGGGSAVIPIIVGLLMVIGAYVVAESMDNDEDTPVSA